MVIAGGLAAWIPSARGQEYSAATYGKNSRERAEAYPADNSGKNVRDRQEAAVTSGDRSNAQSDRDTRKTAKADKELSHAHNVKTITANFQALYDNMSDTQKKTAVFRNRIDAAEQRDK